MPLVLVLGLLGSVAPALAVSGAVNTTFDTKVDGNVGQCIHGSIVNCNQYSAKQYVWLSGNPSQLSAGNYFYVVLDPGGQNRDLVDGGAKNLSSACDPYTNREINIDSSGSLTTINGSTHTFDGHNHNLKYNAVRVGVAPCPTSGGPAYFADTINPGGVYILAV
jgi:hypothetical protein